MNTTSEQNLKKHNLNDEKIFPISDRRRSRLLCGVQRRSRGRRIQPFAARGQRDVRYVRGSQRPRNHGRFAVDGLLRRRLVPHQRHRRFAHEEDRSDGRPEFPARGAHDCGAFLRRGRGEAHRDRDAGEVRADPRAGGERRRYNRLRRRERTGPEPACVRGLESRRRDRLVCRVAVRGDEKHGRQTAADRRRRGPAPAQRDADLLLRNGGRRTAAGDRRAAVDGCEYGRGPGG